MGNQFCALVQFSSKQATVAGEKQSYLPTLTYNSLASSENDITVVRPLKPETHTLLPYPESKTISGLV